MGSGCSIWATAPQLRRNAKGRVMNFAAPFANLYRPYRGAFGHRHRLLSRLQCVNRSGWRKRPMTQSSSYFALSSRLPRQIFGGVSCLMRRAASTGCEPGECQFSWYCARPAVGAKASELKGIRSHESPEKQRLVMDLSAPVEHTLFTLDKPSRVVIDILDTAASSSQSGQEVAQCAQQRSS